MGNRFYRTDPEIRFRELFKIEGRCWIWTGATNIGIPGAYPVFWNGTKKVYAHRWAYEHWVGPIPEGHQIDHVKDRGCRSRLCVNPKHLEAVTQPENLRRARPEPMAVCTHGHEMTEENTRRDRAGRRKGCVQCHREGR